MVRTLKAHAQLIPAGFFVAVLIIGLLTGQWIASGAFTLKRMIAFMAGLVVIVLAVSVRQKYLKALMWLAILTFFIGHRSVYIGRWSYFVPSEIIFWILYLLLLTKGVIQHRISSPHLPSSLYVLVGLTIFGFFSTPGVLSDWDGALSTAKIWLVVLPVFFVVREFITSIDDVRRVLTLLIAVGVGVGSLAILEYFSPSVGNAIPWFFNAQQTYLITDDGFVRAGFTFFGNPIGVILVLWAALILMYKLSGMASWLQKGWFFIALAICILAIFISGARAAWLAFILGTCVLVVSGQFRIWIPLLLVAAVLSVVFENAGMPVEAAGNRLSAYSDTSITWRIEQWQIALEAITTNPLLGIGFRDNSLPHNEFLSFGKHLGLPGLIAFVVLVSVIWFRLQRLYSETQVPEHHRLLQLCVSLMVVWVFFATTHAVLSIPQVTLPYWLQLAVFWRIPAVFQAFSEGCIHSPNSLPFRKRVKWARSVVLHGSHSNFMETKK